MGNYIDEGRILQLMPQLPKTGGAGYSQASDMITLAIEKAESIIDSFIGTKYSLPFSSVPPLLRHLADDLSLYFVYKNIYPGDNMASNAYAEEYSGWKDNAFATLKAIQNEDRVLTATDGSTIDIKSAAKSVRSSHADYYPVFNMDAPTQWSQDPDLLDAIEDERS